MTDNELIARFMGVYVEGQTKKWDYEWSWSCLMPVVKKLRDDDFFASLPQDGIAYVLEVAIDEALLKVDIEEVYNAVIQFIQWYNQNK